MPPEYVHFFPHCLHWRLNPVRHPSGLRISPVMESSPWHEHRGTILDKTLSVAQWRNKCNRRTEWFKANYEPVPRQSPIIERRTREEEPVVPYSFSNKLRY